jgi:SAM-dependent methyltransferase
VIQVLSTALFGESLAMSELPIRKDLVGIGLSDWDGYAPRLAETFTYTNTFYDRAPRLDITAIDPELEGTADFLVASEVFEHIAPPVALGLDNVRRLLKPGGLLVLTVPYDVAPGVPTKEHFPDLHDYRLERDQGGTVLINRTVGGAVQVFEDLIFHGGEGFTLEMRLFARDDLIRDLQSTGFVDVTVHSAPDFKHGIYWRSPFSIPVTARRDLT